MDGEASGHHRWRRRGKGWDEGATRVATLSPDGTRLYVLTHETSALEGARPRSRGLSVIDVETGQEIASRDSEAGEIRIMPDGKRLLLDSRYGSNTTLEVLDAESLASVATLAEWRVQLARDLEGAPVVLATRLLEETTTRFAVLDSETFDVVDSWLGPSRTYWVAPWP